jgi:hypothetical protein
MGLSYFGDGSFFCALLNRFSLKNLLDTVSFEFCLNSSYFHSFEMYPLANITILEILNPFPEDLLFFSPCPPLLQQLSAGARTRAKTEARFFPCPCCMGLFLLMPWANAAEDDEDGLSRMPVRHNGL